MNVLMIDSLIGNEYSFCLCEALHNAGINISLVCTQDRIFPKEAVFNVFRWMPPKKLTTNKYNKIICYLEYIYHIISSTKDNKYDIIHLQFPRNDLIESVIYSLINKLNIHIHLCHTIHNVLPHENTFIDKYIKNIIYRYADHLIVHSNRYKSKICDDYNISKENISVIPHGNFDIYLPIVKINKRSARHELGVKENENMILFFGKIREYKGLDLILDAYAIVAESDPLLRLVIAGSVFPNNKEKYYRKIINENKYYNRIIYCPEYIPFDKVPTYFIAADLVALPYKQIDHSGVIHLAHSFGRPVIATNVGDFEEILGRQDNRGFLVKKNNKNIFAKKVLKAFRNKRKLMSMGLEAKKYSKNEWSWDRVAEMTAIVYHRILSK